MKKYIWLTAPVITILIFTFMPFLAMAQGPDPDAPIDGGLSLLIGAGVAYGAKKYRDQKKKNQAGSDKL
jgi:hypothetical protein